MLQYRRARRERVDVQHAAGIRDLRHAPRAEVAAKEGGLAAIEAQRRKADKLYAEIDRTGFYRGTPERQPLAHERDVPLPSEDLEKKFAKEATAAGLDGLKGHRSVGGMRASIYNAFPEPASTRSSSSCTSSRARTAEPACNGPDVARKPIEIKLPLPSYRSLTIERTGYLLL